MGSYGEGKTRRNGGKVLEGRAGLAVAVVLGVAAIVLAAMQWLMLPDQVVVQIGLGGAHYAPKWLLVLVSAGLGLFGSVWLGASREKTGLMLAVIGVALEAISLVVNVFVF